MNNINSNLFGTAPQPELFSEILGYIENLSLSSQKPVYMWRGQGDINWPIHSAAYRRLTKTRPEVTEYDMAYYECYLLKTARHQGYGYIDGRKISDFELLARLQHHGAATRLIDFSRNILVALWFACRSQPDKTGHLFGIHTSYMGGGENENEEREYSQIVDDEEFLICNHPQTWQPPVVTKRIASQGASFLYSKVVNHSMGSLAFEKNGEKHVSFSVTPKFKKDMLKLLQGTFDISQITMFPDLDGFSYSHSEAFKVYSNERW